MASGPQDRRLRNRQWDREILGLAWPAFLALVAEPMFLLSDAAIIGHLGTHQLAGLGIAATIMQAGVGLCIFLAYGTTAAVARRLGAGDLAGALRQGVDGIWLAVGIGVTATILGVLGTDVIVGVFDASDSVAGYAEDYLRISWLGFTPLLVMLAATGILRGLHDTRTPLYVAVGANLANIVLNVALVYGLGLGIGGAALGTVIAQTGGAGLLLMVVVRAARHHAVPLRPDGPGIRLSARAGVPLLIRTLALRVSLFLGTLAAAGMGATSLATHQLAATIWTFLAFTLDAVAIAAQAIMGRYLGAGDRLSARQATDRMIRWGIGSGVVTGLALAAAAPVLGQLFTPDTEVHQALVPVLLVAAACQVIAGVVFVLDGVLIGAGDGVYLAWASVATLVVYAPLVWWASDLTWLWVAFCGGFMGSRFVALLGRSRRETWMRTGA